MLQVKLIFTIFYKKKKNCYSLKIIIFKMYRNIKLMETSKKLKNFSSLENYKKIFSVLYIFKTILTKYFQLDLS